MQITLSINKRARQWGYIIWSKEDTNQMRSFFNNRSSVHLIFEGMDLGKKNIDWKYNRISIGYRWTRRLSESVSNFILKFDKTGKLNIKCK